MSNFISRITCYRHILIYLFISRYRKSVTPSSGGEFCHFLFSSKIHVNTICTSYVNYKVYSTQYTSVKVSTLFHNNILLIAIAIASTRTEVKLSTGLLGIQYYRCWQYFRNSPVLYNSSVTVTPAGR